jgi:hypothetical protein
MNYRPDITSYIKESLYLMIIGLQFILPIHHCLFFVVSEAPSLSWTQHYIVVRELHSFPFGPSWSCHIILDRRIAIRPYLPDGVVFPGLGEPGKPVPICCEDCLHLYGVGGRHPGVFGVVVRRYVVAPSEEGLVRNMDYSSSRDDGAIYCQRKVPGLITLSWAIDISGMGGFN